jgi:tetratricopeptide (TPR) repeat protein
MMTLIHRLPTAIIAAVVILGFAGCGDDEGGEQTGQATSPETVAAAVDGDWETVWLNLSGSSAKPDDVGMMLADMAAKATSRAYSPEFEFDTVSTDGPLRRWLRFTDSLSQAHPEDPDVMLMAADAAARMARYSEAKQLFTDVIAADSSMALAYSSRGAVNLALLRPDAAMSDFATAMDLNPDLAQPWLNRANLQRRQGNYDEALSDYDRVIELAPDHAIAYNNRGETYRLLGQMEDALADYSHAIEANPEMHTAYNNRGLALAKMGQFERALDDYDKALSIEPDYLPAYYNRGIAWFLSGAYDQAIDDYRHTIELDSSNFQAWYNLAMAYEKAEKTDSVVFALRQFVDRAPAEHEEYVHRAKVRINELTKKQAGDGQ